jgi:PPOX class probable F420-dependent enzyme
MAEMFSDSERALLDLPAFATLTTLAADGAPQMTVMWYRLAGDELHMITPANAQKARNLQRDPRAAILISDPRDSYHYLELRGRVELVRDPDLIRDELRQIAGRYIGERAEAYTAVRDPHTRVLISFRSERAHFWTGTSLSSGQERS